jgi:hypothetical protein
MKISFAALLFLAALSCAQSFGLSGTSMRRATTLYMGAGKEAKRAWATGDLSAKDIFEDENTDAGDAKKKFKLEPETVFFEGPPSATEMILPALGIFTVIGIVPFVSTLARQAWVRYKITSRRVSVQSGIGGKDQSEIIYPDIDEIKFVYRALGSSGDMVLFLKDGAKIELRHVPKFDEIYSYILSKCDAEAQAKSMKLKAAI